MTRAENETPKQTPTPKETALQSAEREVGESILTALALLDSKLDASVVVRGIKNELAAAKNSVARVNRFPKNPDGPEYALVPVDTQTGEKGLILALNGNGALVVLQKVKPPKNRISVRNWDRKSPADDRLYREKSILALDALAKRL